MVALAEVLTVSFLENTTPLFEAPLPIESTRFEIPRNKKEDPSIKTSYLEPYSENGKSKLRIKSISQPLTLPESETSRPYELWVNQRKKWSAEITPLDFRHTRGVSTVGNFYNLIDELSKRHQPPNATHPRERHRSYHDESMDFLATNWKLLSKVLNPGEIKFTPFCFREINLFGESGGGIPDHIALDGTGEVYIIEVGLKLEENGVIDHYKDDKLKKYKKRFMEAIGVRLGIIPSLVSVYVEKDDRSHKIWIQNPKSNLLVA